MKISNVNVKLVEEKEGSRLLAYATIDFENCFRIRDIRIIQGNKKIFVAMPSRKLEENKFKDLCHPTNSDFRREITNAILEKYDVTISLKRLHDNIPLSEGRYYGINKDENEYKVVIFNADRSEDISYICKDLSSETIDELKDEISDDLKSK